MEKIDLIKQLLSGNHLEPKELKDALNLVNSLNREVEYRLNLQQTEKINYGFLENIEGLEINDELLDYLANEAPFVYRLTNSVGDLVCFEIETQCLSNFLEDDEDNVYFEELKELDQKTLENLKFIEKRGKELSLQIIKF